MTESILKVIKINNLNKNYDKLHAVKNVNLEIKKNEVFGIIGPDGAGKTTIFKMLSGIMQPTEGEVNFFGKNIKEARKEIGLVTQQFSFYGDLTIEENLKYSAGTRKIPKELFEERRDKYLKLMGLENFTNRLGNQLSGGMKQKLALCCVLVFQPKILLLDEPTTGVDPISRREFWDVLAALSAENVTIIVATPYLDEAERCNRIAFMHDGEIHQIGTPQELKNMSGFKRLEIITEEIELTENILINASYKENTEIKDVQTFGDRLDILVKDEKKGKLEIQQILEANNLPVNNIKFADVMLENVFVLKLREVVENHSQKCLQPSSPDSLHSKEEPPNIESLIINNENNEKKLAIGAFSLNKFFDRFQAVKDLNLKVHYGEIFGLLGANGAGKTTAIKMLCGLLDATSGKICLAGEYENLRNPLLRQKIGYMSQKFTLYNDLTIAENLKFYCGVYSVPEELQSSKIQWVLNVSGLSGQGDLLTGELPGGWKQRVSFGASVMHEPKILFLDEPTSGVDPLARRQFWKLIMDFARKGTAIIVTTHYLEEAEHCNRVAFMSAGELIVEGSPYNIKSTQSGKLIEISIDHPQRANFILKNNIESWRVSLFGNKLHITLDNPDIELSQILSILKENNIKILSANNIPFSLEDTFINIIEKSKLKVDSK